MVASEDIPAATQLFTPNWIVKYLVQNSLGAQWLATYPHSSIRGLMDYYIEPVEQTDEVNAQLKSITPSTLNSEALTLIDPASGSGHILVEAYELFRAIYLERGYRQRDVAQLILEKNLFGLDIDGRAAQLTGFALMMKGRADDRRLFERGVKLNLIALVDSNGFDAERLAQSMKLADYGLAVSDLPELKRLFEHASTFGSLIQVPEEQLTGYLNGTYRVQAELSSQLGVLPSYTALGMASLLPYEKLDYTEKGGVLADGKPTASLEQRNEILSTVSGMAVKADQLLAMKKEQGREFIVGKRLVYIYHDEIDARGDKAATERDTFEAVRKTIQELADLVRYVVNNLNGNYVVITADHGFLFTETAPSGPDKSKLEDKPAGTVIAKKRYLLGYDLPRHALDRWAAAASAVDTQLAHELRERSP